MGNIILNSMGRRPNNTATALLKYVNLLPCMKWSTSIMNNNNKIFVRDGSSFQSKQNKLAFSQNNNFLWESASSLSAFYDRDVKEKISWDAASFKNNLLHLLKINTFYLKTLFCAEFLRTFESEWLKIIH